MRVFSKRSPASTAAAERLPGLGDLPEWNLDDLYAGIGAPELARDLDTALQQATAFEQRWKGTLLAEAGKGATGGLGEALAAYESLGELMGRIDSFASLVYAGDTSDPTKAKFYGDIQEKMTDASAHLLFFALELNLVDNALIQAALDADPAFGHYRPWVLDLTGGVSGIDLTTVDPYAAELVARSITAQTGLEAISWIAANGQPANR